MTNLERVRDRLNQHFLSREHHMECSGEGWEDSCKTEANLRIIDAHLEEDAERAFSWMDMVERAEKAEAELAELREVVRDHWDHDETWCFACHQPLEQCSARQLTEEKE